MNDPFRTVYVLLFFITFAVPCLAKEDSDQQKLQGRWKIVELKENGKSVEEAVGQIIIIGPNTVSEEASDDKSAGLKYRIDSSKNPKQIDIGNDEKGKEDFDETKENFSKGIYALENDRLRLCFEYREPFPLCSFGGFTRPLAFPKKADERLNVLVLERMKESQNASEKIKK